MEFNNQLSNLINKLKDRKEIENASDNWKLIANLILNNEEDAINFILNVASDDDLTYLINAMFALFDIKPIKKIYDAFVTRSKKFTDKDLINDIELDIGDLESYFVK